MPEPFFAADFFVHAVTGCAGLVVMALAFLALAKIRVLFADHPTTSLSATPSAQLTALHSTQVSDASTEDQNLASFVAALRSPTSSSTRTSIESPEPEPAMAAGPLSETSVSTRVDRQRANFLRDAPNLLSSMRSSFSDLNRTRNERKRQQMLADLAAQLAALAKLTQPPELLPLRQLALGVHGLLTQLAGKPCDITASALRTAAGALVLLESLSRSGFPTDLASNPPIRLLVVDDDAISRVALAMALKKAFPLPDVAPAGEPALALAAKLTYDVIFLDVEMPGMDGYELCAKLRDTLLNHGTPVIFVTRHTDFEAREKSTQSGAQDLIAKPFLSFEIIVKALTFSFRSRLQRHSTLGVAEGLGTTSDGSRGQTPRAVNTVAAV